MFDVKAHHLKELGIKSEADWLPLLSRIFKETGNVKHNWCYQSSAPDENYQIEFANQKDEWAFVQIMFCLANGWYKPDEDEKEE